MAGPRRLFEIAALASGATVGDSSIEYQYDESQFAAFKYADIDNIDPETLVAPNGYHVGAAAFVETRADPDLSFRIDETGQKIPVVFYVMYDDLAERIANLKHLHISPSQSEKALHELDAQVAELRHKSGFTGKLLQFPGNAL